MRMTMLLQPVDRLDEAVDFYRDRLGLQERFRDGDRFAMLDTGSLPLALIAGDERLVDQPALTFSVNDVDRALSELTQGGARVLRTPENGPHERRAVLADPSGHPFVISSKT